MIENTSGRNHGNIISRQIYRRLSYKEAYSLVYNTNRNIIIHWDYTSLCSEFKNVTLKDKIIGHITRDI